MGGHWGPRGEPAGTHPKPEAAAEGGGPGTLAGLRGEAGSGRERSEPVSRGNFLRCWKCSVCVP